MSHESLLVELLVEELPPKALGLLGRAFAELLHESLAKSGLCDTDARRTMFATPRRLAVRIDEVLDQAPARQVTERLMPISVGLDDAGEPTPVLLKKLKSLNLSAEVVPCLKRVAADKGEYLIYDHEVSGEVLLSGLQKALEETIAKLPIPKVMSYQLADGWQTVHFVRPAQGLLALHGTQIVPITALGLEAGRTTLGHRILAKHAPLVIADANEYEQVLEQEGCVIASLEARRQRIEAELEQTARTIGADVRILQDEALLDEVTALVEAPCVIACNFDPAFLEVPSTCLILTMKANQRYFPVMDASGKLTQHFLVVSNMPIKHRQSIRQGNERVIRPRLADAKFFFDQDRKRTLASRASELDRVVYHDKLGSQADRCARVRRIACNLGEHLGLPTKTLEQIEQAAYLAKADLLTDMVGEFPELQGHMGAQYAKLEGLDPAICAAIEEHYQPRFSGDALPKQIVAQVLALADKLETLVGLFSVGVIPTGDKDPFALRRAALGVIRIVMECDLPALQWSSLFTCAASAFTGAPLPDTSEVLSNFFLDRMRGWLKELHDPKMVEAVLSLGLEWPWCDIPKRLHAVKAFEALPQSKALSAAHKRIRNILKKSNTIDETAGQAHISEALLSEPAEKELYVAMQVPLAKSAQYADAGEFTQSLLHLAELREPVDAFFENVMVNAEAMDVRLNRLNLLKTLHQAMHRVADLSELN